MNEYTPETNHVRFRYTEHTYLLDEGEADPAEFDRWLAEVKREAVEKALEPVRALHAKHGNTLHTEPKFVCSHRHCVDDAGDQCAWPCPTIRAIETKETKA